MLKNDITITLEDDSLDGVAFDSFPVIDDFMVELRPYDEGGLHVEFTSASHGQLAHFPAWDHADRDLRHFVPSDVPLGTVAEPFDERDDAWRILLFEQGGYIHVMQGDSPTATTFATFFRVPVTRYVEAWAVLMSLFNPVKDV